MSGSNNYEEEKKMSEIKQLPDSEYFTLDAIDQSALKRFMVSPLAYVDYLEHGLDVSRDALDFGSITHGLVLGSGGEYVEKPDRRTKAGRAEYEELEASGAIMASQADLDTAQLMAERSAPYFMSMPGRAEVALLATDMLSGLKLKGKADWLPDAPDDDGVLRIRDYKTTGKDPMDFPRTAATLGYHIQAAFYMLLYRLCGFDGPLGFEFVVQEKKRPYDYMVWRFAEDCEEIGLAGERIMRALDEISGFQRADPEHWKQNMSAYGLDKTPRVIEYTGWQLDKESEEAGL
jgi:hypothetical protein